jgi:hypothetical protein
MVRQPESQAEHSALFIVEVNNVRSYASTPLYDFMAWGLTKHRDNFITSFNVGKYELHGEF